MTRQPPSNKQAEINLLSAAFISPKTVIPKAMALGLQVSDFNWVRHGWAWEAMLSLREDGNPVSPPTVWQWMKARDRITQQHQEMVDSLFKSGAGSEEAEFWTLEIIDKSLRRRKLGLARTIGQSVFDEEQDAYLLNAEHGRELDAINDRYIRARCPIAGNPADELRETRRWHTNSGIGFIDQWIRLTSGEVHFIAGDPGCGKTTIAVQAAGYNAQHGINTAVIVAESENLEITLSLLLQTGEIEVPFVNKLRYDPNAHTEANLDVVDRLWKEHYEGLPLRVFSTTTGVDEVVSIMSALTQPHLVIVDHAFAIVNQSEQQKNFKEHQQFNQLFSRTKKIAERNNHVVVMMNQFTKEGRRGEERGPDAQYGGSGVQNVASTMIHLWSMGEDDDIVYTTKVGFRQIAAKFWKVRAMLLADENGYPIDPRGKTTSYWLESQYRRIVDRLP